MMRRFGTFLRRFRRSEDGGPTVEFVLVFMPFVILLVSAFELGLLMTRHVMLERGVDMAIREVRLNTGNNVDEDDVKRMICNAAGILPNCMTQLRLEMQPIDPNNWSNIPRHASCTNINNPFAPARNFQNGVDNQIMIVRACAILSPMLPSMGLGYFLAQGDQGYYRLTAMSAFVMEPQ